MVDTTANTDVQSISGVAIDPQSNNPIEVSQTSTVQLIDNGAIREDGFELSVNLTGADVTQPINVALVLDQSGSTANDSGTDFDGDGNNENYLEAQLFAAQELFESYVNAGYDPTEVEITLITYSADAEVRGTFNLSEAADFLTALQDIEDEGPQTTTNFVAGLEAVDDGWTANSVGSDETNVVVFLSDGRPVPSDQDISGAASTLETDYGAVITGIGVGANSSLGALNQLDSDGDAIRALTGADLTDAIVQPLTDADFLRFEILVEGVDDNGDPLTQTITLNDGDPNIITTQLGWSLDCLEIDPNFSAVQDLTITVNSYFAEDPGNPGSGEQVVTTAHTVPLNICFTRGTRILTPSGLVAIEALKAGDTVITRDRGAQVIRWIGASRINRTRLHLSPSLRPIRIKAGALGNDLPLVDLVVSRQHRILVRGWRAEILFGSSTGVLVPAVALCNGDTIFEDTPEDAVEYWHMAFDQHEVVYAEGVEAESFMPAARTLSALDPETRAEFLAIFPQFTEAATAAYPPTRHQPKTAEARALLETLV